MIGVGIYNYRRKNGRKTKEINMKNKGIAVI